MKPIYLPLIGLAGLFAFVLLLDIMATPPGQTPDLASYLAYKIGLFAGAAAPVLIVASPLIAIGLLIWRLRK